MSIVDRARQLRKVIELTAQTLDDEGAMNAVELFPEWKTGTAYTIGEKVQYHKTLYRCLQNHTSQSDWTPDVAVSLFARVLNPSPLIPDWEQPESTNGYSKGDKVRYKGNIYKSLIDNNVWSPEAYPAGWEQIQ